MTTPPGDDEIRLDETTSEPGPSPAKIGAGAFLVLLGIVWLLDQLDIAEIPWRALLPAALIAVGIALVSTTRGGAGHGALITLGIVLTVALTISWAARSFLDISLTGGVGERTVRPSSASEVQNRYNLAIGKLVVDLRGVSFSSSRSVTASVGIGELIVLVPGGVSARAGGRAGIGEVDLSNCDGAGIAVDEACSLGGSGPRLSITATTGIGKVEVRQ